MQNLGLTIKTMRKVVGMHAARMSGVLLLCIMLTGMRFVDRPNNSKSAVAPVTIVTRPWSEMSVDGADPIIAPTTIYLSEGKHRLEFHRRGYQPLSVEIAVEGTDPQHHIFRLEK